MFDAQARATDRRRRFIGGLLVLTLAGCGGEGEPTRETRVKQQLTPRGGAPTVADGQPAVEDGRPRLRWTGCDISKKAYINEAVAAYEKSTGVEVVVTGGGATRGIRATAGGMSDLGGSCRHSLPGRFPDEEGDARLTHVAWDALVFFTHPSNPVDGITSEQARKILLGEIRNWEDLGGPKRPILPVFRQQTVAGKLSGVGYMTRLLLFGDPGVDYRDDAIFYTSSGPIEEYVESTPFAFAVTGVSSARKRNVKVLELDGVQPRDKSNLFSGKYPLIRPLYLVTQGVPSGASKDFVDWILGAEGQAVLSGAGTVNLNEGAELGEHFAHWPEGDSVIRKR